MSTAPGPAVTGAWRPLPTGARLSTHRQRGPVAQPKPTHAGCFRLSRWRSKYFRFCEVNTIDYLAHPTYMIWVTASGRRPRHPRHLALRASHPAADAGRSPPAAIPAQLRIGLLLASAHLLSPVFRTQPRITRVRAVPAATSGPRSPSLPTASLAGRPPPLRNHSVHGAPVHAHTWWKGRPALIHPGDRRSVRGRRQGAPHGGRSLRAAGRPLGSRPRPASWNLRVAGLNLGLWPTTSLRFVTSGSFWSSLSTLTACPSSRLTATPIPIPCSG